jgi:hypothetical protein
MTKKQPALLLWPKLFEGWVFTGIKGHGHGLQGRPNGKGSGNSWVKYPYEGLQHDGRVTINLRGSGFSFGYGFVNGDGCGKGYRDGQ